MYYEWQLLGYRYSVENEDEHASFCESVNADSEQLAVYFTKQRFPGWHLRVDRVICKALDIDKMF